MSRVFVAHDVLQLGEEFGVMVSEQLDVFAQLIADGLNEREGN